MIGKEDKPKGVLRFRRMVNKDENNHYLRVIYMYYRHCSGSLKIFK